jgi:hypothetical protein
VFGQLAGRSIYGRAFAARRASRRCAVSFAGRLLAPDDAVFHERGFSRIAAPCADQGDRCSDNQTGGFRLFRTGKGSLRVSGMVCAAVQNDNWTFRNIVVDRVEDACHQEAAIPEASTGCPGVFLVSRRQFMRCNGKRRRVAGLSIATRTIRGIRG